MRQELPGNTINLLNQTTIRQMIWLVGAAAFVVSVDSGPMHIAAAINPRLLSIHTWSDPRLVGPFSEEAWIWQGGEIRRQQLRSPFVAPGRSPENARYPSNRRFAKHDRPRRRRSCLDEIGQSRYSSALLILGSAATLRPSLVLPSTR